MAATPAPRNGVERPAHHPGGQTVQEPARHGARQIPVRIACRQGECRDDADLLGHVWPEAGGMKYFEDVAVGDVSEIGSFTFTQEAIKRFATAYDPQPFH